jgi:hypothetical protein
VRGFLRHGIKRPRRNPGFNPPWYAAVEPALVTAWHRRSLAEMTGVLAFVVIGVVGLIASFLLAALVEIALVGTAVVPLILLGAGVWGLWHELQGRTLAATPQGVVVASTPLASARKREFPAASIAQLVSLGDGSGFTLLLITTDNERVPLLDGLHDWAHVLYLEQQIENVLGIEDVAVTHVRRPNV